MIIQPIIIGCEESQEICKAFRAKGIETYSCDLQPCSGGRPEWHIQGDLFEVLKSRKWKMGIFHPPCTYLTVSNNGSMANGCSKYTAEEAKILRQGAIDFFMRCVNSLDMWCIENPIGIMSTIYRKPNQTIQPYNYGHGETKATCLWLRRLPRLNGFNVVEGRENRIWKMTPSPERSKERSKTYTGMAQAMANQWSYLLK
jgi:hypothetical protein